MTMGPSWWDLCSPIKNIKTEISFQSHISKKDPVSTQPKAVYLPGRGPSSRTKCGSTLTVGFTASKLGEMCLLFKWPRLWHSVITAQTDQNRNTASVILNEFCRNIILGSESWEQTKELSTAVSFKERGVCGHHYTHDMSRSHEG